MKMNLLIVMFACLFVLDCVISFGGAWMDDARTVDASATDPLNATYLVDHLSESGGMQGVNGFSKGIFLLFLRMQTVN